MHMCVYAYVSHMYVPGVLGDQKRALDLLELELWVVLSHHVDVENQTQALWKCSQCS